MDRYNAILFDFDGVLCKDYFYNNLPGKHDDVYNFTQNKIFRGNSDIPDKRMRNEVTMHDVNKYISDETGIIYDKLHDLFIESIKNMKIDNQLLEIAKQIKGKGIKIALVTNNMDVFNEVTIPHNALNEIFTIIINSSDYGMLKHEQNGKLFDIAIDALQENDFSKILLIDDSQKARTTFESKGGQTYPYTTFENFYEWAKPNLEISLER